MADFPDMVSAAMPEGTIKRIDRLAANLKPPATRAALVRMWLERALDRAEREVK